MTARVSTETLAVDSLSHMPECELGEGAPDVRGWEVTTPTSVHVGVVKDLLVDLATMRVRYLDVEVDAGPNPRRVLFPIGTVWINDALDQRSEEHTSELQSRQYLVCRLLLEKKKKNKHK